MESPLQPITKLSISAVLYFGCLFEGFSSLFFQDFFDLYELGEVGKWNFVKPTWKSYLFYIASYFFTGLLLFAFPKTYRPKKTFKINQKTVFAIIVVFSLIYFYNILYLTDSTWRRKQDVSGKIIGNISLYVVVGFSIIYYRINKCFFGTVFLGAFSLLMFVYNPGFGSLITLIFIIVVRFHTVFANNRYILTKALSVILITSAMAITFLVIQKYNLEINKYNVVSKINWLIQRSQVTPGAGIMLIESSYSKSYDGIGIDILAGNIMRNSEKILKINDKTTITKTQYGSLGEYVSQLFYSRANYRESMMGCSSGVLGTALLFASFFPGILVAALVMFLFIKLMEFLLNSIGLSTVAIAFYFYICIGRFLLLNPYEALGIITPLFVRLFLLVLICGFVKIKTSKDNKVADHFVIT